MDSCHKNRTIQLVIAVQLHTCAVTSTVLCCRYSTQQNLLTLALNRNGTQILSLWVWIPHCWCDGTLSFLNWTKKYQSSMSFVLAAGQGQEGHSCKAGFPLSRVLSDIVHM